MQVRVYYNLNRKLWSVQHHVPEKGWRVREHLSSLVLANVRFQISEAGRQRVIREQRKNVHAYAIGELVARTSVGYTHGSERLSYNPFKAGYFVDHYGNKIDHAERAVFTRDRKVLT